LLTISIHHCIPSQRESAQTSVNILGRENITNPTASSHQSTPPLAPREDEKAKKGANQQPPKASLLLLLEKEKEVAFDHHLSTLPIHDHENDPHERGGTTLLDRTDLEMYNAPTFRAAQQCHCRDNNQTLESP